MFIVCNWKLWQVNSVNSIDSHFPYKQISMQVDSYQSFDMVLETVDISSFPDTCMPTQWFQDAVATGHGIVRCRMQTLRISLSSCLVLLQWNGLPNSMNGRLVFFGVYLLWVAAAHRVRSWLTCCFTFGHPCIPPPNYFEITLVLPFRRILLTFESPFKGCVPTRDHLYITFIPPWNHLWLEPARRWFEGDSGSQSMELHLWITKGDSKVD